MSDVMQTMTRIINSAAANTADNDTLITLLSLTCLFSILNRNQSKVVVQNATTNPSSNPLQRVLSEITKGDENGPSPDLLMSLLPLLNSPQIKSKINPTNIATLFGLLNGLSGDKTESKKNTNKVQNLNEHKETKEEAVISPDSETPEQEETVVLQPEHPESEKKTPSHLNWKSNF